MNKKSINFTFEMGLITGFATLMAFYIYGGTFEEKFISSLFVFKIGLYFEILLSLLPIFFLGIFNKALDNSDTENVEDFKKKSKETRNVFLSLLLFYLSFIALINQIDNTENKTFILSLIIIFMAIYFYLRLPKNKKDTSTSKV